MRRGDGGGFARGWRPREGVERLVEEVGSQDLKVVIAKGISVSKAAFVEFQADFRPSRPCNPASIPLEQLALSQNSDHSLRTVLAPPS